MKDTWYFRQGLRIVWDCASWIGGALLVAAARYDFTLSSVQWSSVLAYAAAACVLQVALGETSKLYRGRYRIGSFDEAAGLAITVAATSLALFAVFIALRGVVVPASFPRAIAVLTPGVALLSMAAARWAYRAWDGRGGSRDVTAEKVLIYGAGNAGDQLIRLLITSASAPYKPVGLVDDDRAKRHLRLHGIPVLGTRSDLATLASEKGATAVILAIPAATAELVRDIASMVEGAGLRFLVVPTVAEMVGGRVRISDVREVDIADILGRRQVETDLDEIASYLTNRVVMVTGAGGSIGSELARQIHRFGPSELVLLDRDESALHAVQLSIYGRGLLDTPDMVLADIRDVEALDKVFEAHKPEVVFHAAALKHLPMLEQYPDEGWKTNVLGSLNVLRIAHRHGCQRFVNVSTDKAADATSVLGRSKRIAERLTAWYALRLQRSYLSVRFGNVLGSRGSVLHTFTTQIRAGGPVTVTHPGVTRYFMTIPEACELTIQAGAIGSAGEVLVLDMGEPVKILDVAQRLVSQSRSPVEIVFTGLRAGEKMHEVLFSHEERGVSRCHPLIFHVPVPPLDPSELPATAPYAAAGQSRESGAFS